MSAPCAVDEELGAYSTVPIRTGTVQVSLLKVGTVKGNLVRYRYR